MPGQSTDPHAGRGIGVVQPQSGLDYPFVAPGGSAPTEAVGDVENLFADFYLSYDDPGYYQNVPRVAHPLRVYWLYGFGTGPAFAYGAAPLPGVAIPAPTHAADLVVIDAANRVVFDSTAADDFVATEWGEHYTVYEWAKTTKPNAAVCRAVTYKDVHTNNDPVPMRPVSFCPRAAILDERAIEKIPKRVLAMRVQNGNCVTPWFQNKVTFVNGFNTELQIGAVNDLATRFDINPGFGLTPAEAGRRVTEIALSAAAGSGRGQFGLCAAPTPDCAENRPTNVCPPGDDILVAICDDAAGEEIKSINGVRPDKNGNIFMNADGCLYTRRPALYVNGQPTQTANQIAFGADCGPCCACVDYVDIAKYLNVVAERYRAIGDRVAAVKAVHEQNIARWNAQRECRYQRPLRLFIAQQPCPCVDVVLMYCNHCETCAENVILTTEFTTTPSGGSGRVFLDYSQIVSDNQSEELNITGGWPIFSVALGRVQAGQSAYARIRLCFCPQQPFTITGTLRGTKTGGPILAGCDATAAPASASATQILDC
jgi:hypothetical protein